MTTPLHGEKRAFRPGRPEPIYSGLMFRVVPNGAGYDIYGPTGPDPTVKTEKIWRHYRYQSQAISACQDLCDAWSGGVEQARIVISRRPKGAS